MKKLIALVAAGLLAACTATTDTSKTSASAPQADIVDTAVAAGSFNTLVISARFAPFPPSRSLYSIGGRRCL